MSNIEKLMEDCTKKTDHNFWNLVKWSFMDNFKELQNISLFNEVDRDDMEQFIKICDNRLDRSKTYLKDIVVVLGFTFASLSIILAIAVGEKKIPFLVPNFSINIIIASLILILVGLLAYLAHYRSQIHAWMAFKEIALMKCTGKVKKPKETT